MILGLAIIAIRVSAPIEKIFPQLFKETKLNIPKAPSLGLLLDEPFFTDYNLDMHTPSENEVIPTYRYKRDFTGKPKLLVSESKLKDIELFKQTQIYNALFKEEEQKQS